MGLFGAKQQSDHFESNYLGFWIKVYSNRVEFKNGVGSKSIPLTQIASVNLPLMGIMKVIIETTGGQKYEIPTMKKKEVKEAIYNAIDKLQSN